MIIKSDRIDELLEIYSGNAPGAALLISKNGVPLFDRSVGFADIENNTPVTMRTNFRLASLTKTFTAAAIMLLKQRGLLSTDDVLAGYFPNSPRCWHNISIRHLLNHTSGLIDYEDLIPADFPEQLSDADVLRLLLNEHNLYFSPGSAYRYSNGAFILLKEIIEKLTGTGFNEFLQENIFKPAGMLNSAAHTEGVTEVKCRAFGHVFEKGGWIRRDQNITSATLGDGGIYSSAADLIKWDSILYTDKLLNAANRQLMFSRSTLNDGSRVDYGLGWHITDFNGTIAVYHTGDSIGFRNIIFRIPDEKMCIIFLTCRDEGDMLQFIYNLQK